MSSPDDYLLVSDLDDTLLGDDEALSAFVEFRESIAHRVRIHLVYASGRFYKSIERDLQQTDLPPPRGVIGGVGTEVVLFPGGKPVEGWRERMSDQWSAPRVREVLADESVLELQPEESQSDYKVSYFVEDASQAQLGAWRLKLERAGIASRVIYSSNRDLDFLPEGVDKGTAAVFLAAHLDLPPGRVMVSGNSANDSALFEHGFRGIVVGNAHEELKAYATHDHVYLSPHALARGVRDGVEHWLRIDGMSRGAA